MSLSNESTMVMPVAPAYQGGYGYGNGCGSMWGGDWASWITLFLIFGMFGWGGYGNFGGFGGGNGLGFPSGQGWATRADINEGFALNNLQGGQRDILGAVTDGFHGVDNAVCQLGYNTQQGFNAAEMSRAQQQAAMMQQLSAMQFANQQCCCDELAAIKDVKYTIAQEECTTRNLMQSNTRDIIDNQNSGINAIMGKLSQMEYNGLNDKYQAALAENQALKFQASQAAQNSYLAATMDANQAELIRRLGRDCPVAAYVVPNPNCCYGNPVGVMSNGCGCNNGCGC